MKFDPVTRSELPSDIVTELHLFRHGAVQTGGKRLAYGHLDLPLRALGQEQHNAQLALARELTAPSGVLSSDLQRCLSLGASLAQLHGQSVQALPELREQAMGDWEGRPWGALSEEQPQAIQDYWNDYVGARPPGGESLQDLSDRVAQWWAESWPRLQGGSWWMAAHAGVIRVLLSQLLERPLDQALRFAPMRGSYTHLLIAESGAVVNVMGERPLRPRRARGEGPRRIALSGSAGVGKTTLGRALSERLDLPFIDEGMRRRLEGGLMLHRLGREQLRELIWELWQEQEQAEALACERHGGFVADRGSIDFAAFYLYYRYTERQDNTAAFMSQAIAHAQSYERVVVLPWGALPLASDGVRSTNPWLQRHFQAVLEGMVRAELQPHQVLWLPSSVLKLKERVQWVVEMSL